MTGPETLLPGNWDANRQAVVSAAAIAVPLAVSIAARGSALLVPLVLTIGLAVLWHLVFARLRGRSSGWDGIVTAMIFVVMVPAAVPPWQLGLALSFGLVLGDLVFGGRGRGFLSPAAVGLAFLLFSFPASEAAASGTATAISAIVGGALFLVAGILSWRVVAGFAAGMVGLALPWDLAGGWPGLPEATLILGLVFLVGDPVAAACTNAGRWVYGLLAGVLVVLLEHAGGGILSSVVFAALLASIFAPLIDQAVISANVRRRARRQRHG